MRGVDSPGEDVVHTMGNRVVTVVMKMVALSVINVAKKMFQLREMSCIRGVHDSGHHSNRVSEIKTIMSVSI